MEPVRLVIWDLDGVFWNGTLTEGGASLNQTNHAILITLAQRGIISAICSKNDSAPVQTVLERANLWQYFVFPSIGWSPKGPRLKALIDSVQLRPETVLFIDDEPANLAEAAHYVPGIQTAGPDCLPTILQNPLLAGKPDPTLSRLAHYKLLESRQAAAAQHGTDNTAFLRASGIELSIEHDIEPYLDRAIELINRTNQLNFTKNRLPEDPGSARHALREQINLFDTLSGLVKLKDRYGDYGFIGFFSLRGRYGAARLTHFCFSCRILNMGVEAFLYRWLGRPALEVKGQVVSDPVGDATQIDWISLADGRASAEAITAPKLLDRLVLRGGCDLNAMCHYLAGMAEHTHIELNTSRDDRQFRIDTLMLLNWIFDPMPEEVREALLAIGYQPSDWQSGLALPPGPRTVWALSFWTDSFLYLYKHKTLDLTVPFLMQGDPHALQDVTFMNEAEAQANLTNGQNFDHWQALRANFWGIGNIFEELVTTALDKLLAAAGEAMIIIILAPEDWLATDGLRRDRPAERRFNGFLRAALADKPNVHLLDFAQFVPPDKAVPEMFHYDRIIYRRAATHIIGLIRARFG